MRCTNLGFQETESFRYPPPKNPKMLMEHHLFFNGGYIFMHGWFFYCYVSFSGGVYLATGGVVLEDFLKGPEGFKSSLDPLTRHVLGHML